MRIAGLASSRFGVALSRTPVSEPRLRKAASAIRAGTARLTSRILAALEGHTRHQIELVLGERVIELQRAIRNNRADETRNKESSMAASAGGAERGTCVPALRSNNARPFRLARPADDGRAGAGIDWRQQNRFSAAP